MNRKIRKAAVIGSGIMGGGIAALLAGAGIRTLLLDIVPPDLKEAEKNDPKARNRMVQAGLDATVRARPAAFMSRSDQSLIEIGNLEDDFDKLTGCDWIVEVVVERLDIKQALFRRVETVRKKDAVVSTNTSGIPLAAICQGLGAEFRQHFLGTHFFNPVRYMKMLEIIPGEDTTTEVLQFMADFGERILGKGIVWAKDTPNFVGNRIGVHGLVKGMQAMVDAGISIAEADALFGTAMGRPKTAMFKTADLVGLDTMAHTAANNYDLAVDDEQRDAFVLPGFVKPMLEKNLLGNKTGGGFYKTEKTPDFKKVRKVLDTKTLEYRDIEKPDFPCLAAARAAATLPEKINAMVCGDDRGSRYVWEVVAHSLIYAANRIPEICDTIVDIDNAMRWGYNFEIGPFETWDALGVEKTVDRMVAESIPVPEKVRQMLAAGNASFYRTENGQRFYFDFDAKAYKPMAISASIFSLPGRKAAGKTVRTCGSASLVDMDDGVFCLEFHTKMNALNPELIDFFHEALAHVDENGAGLVIGNQAAGMPAAFSAGADLAGIAAVVKEKRFADIDALATRLQYAIHNATYAPFPVVAAPYGLALGGGCEICLGADRIVAHAELYMGLVEIGVGLLPAGGGCLNLYKKLVSSLPAAVQGADLAKYFIPAFQSIAMARVSTSAAEAREIGFLGPRDRIVFNRDYLLGEARKEVLRMCEDGYAAPMKTPIQVMGEAGQGMINAELYNMHTANYISDYDAVLAKRIAFVISGGQVRDDARIEEDAILTLEREAFIDFLKDEKTMARIEHMLKTGKPLRN